MEPAAALIIGLPDLGSTGAVHAIKWSIQRRYMSLELLAPLSDTPPVSLPPVAV